MANASENQPLLSCRGISKRFGAVEANRSIDLDVHAGEIQAILGENGAGKSTLMSIIAGRYRPDGGEIFINGRAVQFSSPAGALQQGIGMVYQRFMLVKTLTVAENIRLAAGARGKSPSLSAIRSEILELADRYGLSIDPDQPVHELSMGERQRVEILKLLVQSARVLIFDEPTAVLAQPDVEGFFAILQRLKADGCGIVFITHKLEEVLAVADRIAILRRGRIIAQVSPDRIGSKHELARLMVGRELVLRVDKPDVVIGDTVLDVSDLTATDGNGRPAFEDISFSVRRGEIFSIIGVAGNGQTALSEALNGLSAARRGTIRFMGRPYTHETWAEARHPEIAFVPEDRHHAGSIAGMDLADNFILTRLDQAGRGFFLDTGCIATDIQAAVARFNIVAPSARTLAGHLSGGNLQKLILARELSRNPDLFIAEQPTQGLDINATEEIWQALLAQRARSAVLLFTGDLKEAIALSDRIAVMFRGRILDVIDASDSDAVGRIGLLMAGTME